MNSITLIGMFPDRWHHHSAPIFIYNGSNIYVLLGKVTFFPVLLGKATNITR